MGVVYDKVMEFKRKYPSTVSWWRLKKHCAVVEKHLNPGEEVIYAFCGQKNEGSLDLFNTCAVVLSNKRILIGRKRMLFGYMLTTITPDLFNDLEVYNGILWGNITIDTIKEEVIISNLSKKSLPEIETNISEFMMAAKQKYASQEVQHEYYKQYNDVK